MPLTIEQDLLRADEALLRVELEAAGARFKGQRNCHCPFHDDQTPSAAIFRGEDGAWRFWCQTCNIGGDIFDVRAITNKRTPGEELRAVKQAAPPATAAPLKVYPTSEAIRQSYKNLQGFYQYTNPVTGKPDMIVVRWFNDQTQKKSYTQYRPQDGGFVAKGPDGKWPLYNRGRMAAAARVVVVEGEKCVHALHDLGIVATTSPGGAGKALHTDWTPLAGKTCDLWPDNDAPCDGHPKGRGYSHMLDVQEILTHLDPPATVRWVNIDALELPVKGDVADYIDRYKGWSKEDIKAQLEADVLADSTPVNPISKYSQYQADAIAGKRQTMNFPWRLLTKATRALIPGTTTCIIGDPGSGKSLLCTEAFVCWKQCGVKCSIYYLEDSIAYHMARAHAMLARNSHLTDADWVRDHPDQYATLEATYADTLADLERSMWDSEKQQTLEEIAEWIEERAKAGSEIIVVDPITAAAPSSKPWIADCEFIVRAKSIATRYSSRIVLVVHPKKGNRSTAITLDDMAGGAAYGRLTHSVLWLEVYDKTEEVPVRVMSHHPPEFVLPNRVVKVLKCRNGIGRGKRFAFNFDGDSLTFQELGLIEKT